MSEVDRKPNAPGTRGAAADMSDAELASVRQYSTDSAASSTGLAEAQREVRALLDGGKPSPRPAAAFGPWQEPVLALREAYERAGTDGVRNVWNALARADPSLYRLVSASAQRKTTWTAAELLAAEFPEPEWIVPDLLPVGLTCLAGRPKVGKSWLLLQLAHAVATGGMMFGRHVKRGRVLYLALEDSARRLRDRCARQGIGPNADITFELQWLALDGGGLARLQADIEAGAYRLVITDTFSRVAGALDQDDVGAVTIVMSSLQELAESGDRGIVLSDHHRKPNMMATDPIDDILGSTAKAAIVDTAWGLYRQRGKRETQLKIVGRDVEETELALQWDSLTCCWQCLGKADDVRHDSAKAQVLAAARELSEIGETPTVSSIAKHLALNKGYVSRVANELIATGKVRQGKARGNAIPLEVVD